MLYNWMQTMYGAPVEEAKEHAPVPKGKMVQLSLFLDANLMHDMVMGRFCTGILEFLNQTPIDWFSKRQNQVEMATYGSEFMVARQAMERIIDLHYKFYKPLVCCWMVWHGCLVTTNWLSQV